MSGIRAFLHGWYNNLWKPIRSTADGALITSSEGGTSISPQAAQGAHVHEPAANTAAVITLPAVANQSNVIGLIAWSYDGLPTGGSLTVQLGATQVFKIDITTSGPGFIPFNTPLQGSLNTAFTITLSAGGAGVSGIVNIHAWSG